MDPSLPRVCINVAMTADGKIDTTARRGAVISSAEDKARVDRLRAEVDAVLVGGRTLLAEDPALTVRAPRLRAARVRGGRPENPAKVGVVSELGPRDLPAGSRFMTAGPARVFVFTTRRTAPEAIRRLESAGAAVEVAGERRVDLRAVLASLGSGGIRSVLVEGGGTLIAEFLRLDLADELSIYLAPRIFGGASAPTLADGPGFEAGAAPQLRLESVRRLDPGGGILARYVIARKE